ncbi:Zn(2+) transporter ZRG17 ASCRUDRAFT_14403 [Ascoidea rubescens DSM 1968]|uniref:Cation efflux protein n=1 Tax=Ascoidea rubescens DSM 1968 TaxID=1344418 RepID=A0A1D2VDX3_9ASCO|nr:hypothetical protein ASCRUDRAFT_14403 [Ascoidea rubescens DSM 1968]ODV59799.1 hypothetical protein ASCRUDRAFT_14403 [Ascoidea rubescens DSM 1968]
MSSLHNAPVSNEPDLASSTPTTAPTTAPTTPMEQKMPIPTISVVSDAVVNDRNLRTKYSLPDLLNSYTHSSAIEESPTTANSAEIQNSSKKNFTKNNKSISSVSNINDGIGYKYHSSNKAMRPKSMYNILDFTSLQDSDPAVSIKDSSNFQSLNTFSGLSPAVAFNSSPKNRPSLYPKNSLSSLKYIPPPPSLPISSNSKNNSPENSRPSSPMKSSTFSSSPKIRKKNSFNSVSINNSLPIDYKPFNYQSKNVMMNNSNFLQKPSHRKGHRYKHSSVSMNFFQEPKSRKPLNIAISLPIPNVKEFIESMTFDQKTLVIMTIIHVVFAGICFLVGFNFDLLDLSILSHLVFFDSINNFVVCLVNIFKNFEVWNKASIKFPFGLSRLELIAGFALSISLCYTGFDLFTHIFEEFVISIISADMNHSHHSHGFSSSSVSNQNIEDRLNDINNNVIDINDITDSDNSLNSIANNNINDNQTIDDNDNDNVNWVLYQLLIIIIMALTIINSKFSQDKNYENSITDSNNLTNSFDEEEIFNIDTKIETGNRKKSFLLEIVNKYIILNFKKIMDFSSNFHFIKNPIKILILIYSFYLLIYSSLNNRFEEFFNAISTFQKILITILILYFSIDLIKKLSLPILLSYPINNDKIFKKDINDIQNSIVDLENFKKKFKIEKILISKINLTLWIVLIKIKMRGGSDDDEIRLRYGINDIVKSVLKKRGNSESNFEITIDIDRL